MTNNSPAIPDWLLNTTVPDSINDDMRSGLGMESAPYLSIENQRFNLIDANRDRLEVGEYDKKIGLYVDLCIVDTNRNISRVFYDRAANPYEPGAQNFNPPECWSDNGYAPSQNCMKPQWSVCATCPKAEWGSEVSAVSGKDIPACRSYKKIAFILADNMLQAGDPALDMLWLLRIPPNSQKKHLKPYVDWISKKPLGTRMLTVTDVITRVSFDATVQGTLNFAAVGLISERLGKLRVKAWSSSDTDAIVGRNDVAISEDKQKQIVAQRGRQPASEPAEQRREVTAPAAASISQRAIETRSAASGGRQPPLPANKGRNSKPKTVAPPPKEKLQQAQATNDPFDPGDIPEFLDRRGELPAAEQSNREFDHSEPDGEAQEAAQHFGVATNAAEPPSALDAQLDALMGRPVGS